MREAVKLTPLTPEEQTFAEENYEALVKAMRTHHLSNDMYDVAAMGFLHAVKKWFARPDLRQWSFQTIVNKTVWSKLSGEREREKRRIQTVSLDEVIPGTDGLTYGTIITDANTSYLRREESKTMKINFFNKYSICHFVDINISPVMILFPRSQHSCFLCCIFSCFILET